ncbi:hypothetical protein [uncultured Clostridium sp.]|uniref:hypothetical protein n=1 Tax=uncultured Clostridium sp. TaxID=59620 RepID=UPI0025D8079E|nr:hypothetical protein [uncultured Clostridium sp.]
MAFEDIIVKSIMNNEFREEVLKNYKTYNLSEEEYNVLKNTKFDMISSEIDERNALSSLAMWGSCVL